MIVPNAIWVIRSDQPIAGAAQIIVIRRASAFRGCRIAVPDSIARYFSLEAIYVQNQPQLRAPMSAELCAVRLTDRALLDLRDGKIAIAEDAVAEFGCPIRIRVRSG